MISFMRFWLFSAASRYALSLEGFYDDLEVILSLMYMLPFIKNTHNRALIQKHRYLERSLFSCNFVLNKRN